MNLDIEIIKKQVTIALDEDVGSGDITAELIPKDKQGAAIIKTRAPGVLCGQAWVIEVFRQLHDDVEIHWLRQDRDWLEADEIFCELSGPLTALLTGERTAVNFLQMLSGTATLTRQFKQAMGTDCKTTLLDTRKTIPGCRYAQKYAVCCGGGENHRMGLYDAFLVKENHIQAIGDLSQTLIAMNAVAGGRATEVEVESLHELTQVLPYPVDTIMLDNFDLEMIKQAIVIRDKFYQEQGTYIRLEVSGNIDLHNIIEYVLPGVDAISVGALTKHVHALDLSMQIT